MSPTLYKAIALFQLPAKLRWFWITLLFGLGLWGPEALAQKRQREANKDRSNNTIIDYFEQMPEYPGGYNKLLQLIARNTRYPSGATKRGKVFVGFIITKTGAVDSIRLSRGLEPVLDQEALRVARLMQHWIPAKQNGRPVDVRYTMPIYFPAATHPALKKENKE